MKQTLKRYAIHGAAAAALLLGGLPLMAQELEANAPPLPPLPPLQAPDMGGGMGPGGMDRGPMSPHRPPMERAFRMGPRGRWWDNPEMVRASYRARLEPKDEDYNIGFRCAMN